ncbi:hypothetical protein H6G17_19865 [Chroococcidiopsis sp. FACHB-1243]|uniref:hypothetical protein n=1 Tax=Chroococcidiopsis sp. [FACHB-1243] TaxID=2692781 RepID=UPI00178594EB|nr:hypothetical protein [Chroococcidiopsis sp. [FACHB-1243]]MBD2307728.1 hypothetical protein [Chroococcidiopsis sp. [FACHB-1243]]
MLGQTIGFSALLISVLVETPTNRSRDRAAQQYATLAIEPQVTKVGDYYELATEIDCQYLARNLCHI